MGLLLVSQLPRVAAAPLPQLTIFPTPTPGPDGRIIYIVQPGDTLWRIAAISGLSLDEIRLLNNLAPDESLVVGQALLLGLGGPVQVSPTPGASPTPTSILPTSQPIPGSGILCILVYDDVNGDAFHQETESAISGAAISISNQDGTVSQTTESAVLPENAPICIEDLEEGEYNITIAIPEGYNPTTRLNYTLLLVAGDETILDFGAQLNTESLEESPPPEEGGRSPLLGVVGGLLLVFGIGLAVFAGRLRRQNIP